MLRRTRKVSAAPGGASAVGEVMMGPPGRASGTAGVSNRSRARPGCSLGGTIWATAADERTTNATAAAMARTPANMDPNPANYMLLTEFYVRPQSGRNRRQAPSTVTFRQFFQMFQ